MFLAISQPILDRFLWFKDRQLGKYVVSKVQHMTGRKTACNRSRPVFFGFSNFQQTSQLATKKFQNLCNCNWWFSLLQLGSVQFRSFFRSSKLDLWTLLEISCKIVSFIWCVWQGLQLDKINIVWRKWSFFHWKVSNWMKWRKGLSIGLIWIFIWRKWVSIEEIKGNLNSSW